MDVDMTTRAGNEFHREMILFQKEHLRLSSLEWCGKILNG